VEVLQAKLVTRVAKLDEELLDDEVLADDKEEHKEVFTLGQMDTQL
jgi:hypothetical protein